MEEFSRWNQFQYENWSEERWSKVILAASQLFVNLVPMCTVMTKSLFPMIKLQNKAMGVPYLETSSTALHTEQKVKLLMPPF